MLSTVKAVGFLALLEPRIYNTAFCIRPHHVDCFYSIDLNAGR